jgi:CBS domain-containing protein
MQAKDIMARDVIIVSETSTVNDVAKVLLDRGISAVPVVDDSGRVTGMVSEGDLLHRSESGTRRRRSWWLSLFADPEVLADEFVKEHSRRVSDVMTRNVITARPDTEVVEIAELLEKNRIKRVPIIEDGKLVGIVSRANLIQALTRLPEESEPAQGLDDSQIRERILARLQAEPWSGRTVGIRELIGPEKGRPPGRRTHPRRGPRGRPRRRPKSRPIHLTMGPCGDLRRRCR